jgi:hypothetical protein
MSLACVDQTHGTQQHRAESWLQAAKQYQQDPDIHYITLWISLCACANMPESQQSRFGERVGFQQYVAKLVRCDKGELARIVWEAYPNTIRGLLDNPYVWDSFWRAQREQEPWEEAFGRERKRASRYFKERNIEALLVMVFDRLATLRNQMLFGGATYKSRVNRVQIYDAAELLGELVPAVLAIMKLHPEEDWGTVYYPVMNRAEATTEGTL